MKNAEKYTRSFFEPPQKTMKWAQRSYIDAPPRWCSVDLRDGNQSLIVPMNLEEKLEFFSFLVRVGFKEIEVGFPAASQTEYEFCRQLIERKLIPDDVTIQVLTQAREHIIAKTFNALRGAKKAIVHLYNSTSQAQRKLVFRKSESEIIDLAVFGAELMCKYRDESDEFGGFVFEYSPESFTGTEPQFALDICNAVIDVWKPTAKQPVIINLPVTVQVSMPHVYANQIEYMSDNLHCRENVCLSLHPHNDRGCAVADCEMGLLAGAQRVEGTLFGNGERTGNADIITLAMNMYSQGVDPMLDFSNLPKITEEFERITKMHVYERQPYSGELVFAAFSGSHQDAIAKGIKWHREHPEEYWNVPYLPIDPSDIGREYDGDVIRINSQSGKGGIGYIMETKFGVVMPYSMRESFGYAVKDISDKSHRELMPDELYKIFIENYVNLSTPLSLESAHYVQRSSGEIGAALLVIQNGKQQSFDGSGNGRLDAVSDALRRNNIASFTVETYTEHALTTGSKAQAASYVGIRSEDGKMFWGCGIHNDIMAASVNALFSAVNRMLISRE